MLRPKLILVFKNYCLCLFMKVIVLSDIAYSNYEIFERAGPGSGQYWNRSIVLKRIRIILFIYWLYPSCFGCNCYCDWLIIWELRTLTPARTTGNKISLAVKTTWTCKQLDFFSPSCLEIGRENPYIDDEDVEAQPIGYMYLFCIRSGVSWASINTPSLKNQLKTIEWHINEIEKKKRQFQGLSLQPSPSWFLKVANDLIKRANKGVDVVFNIIDFYLIKPLAFPDLKLVVLSYTSFIVTGSGKIV